MLILTLDACAPLCGAAVVDVDPQSAAMPQALWCDQNDFGRDLSERLAPWVQAGLGAANKAPSDLDRLCVSTGPGGFTGVRATIAFIRGLSLALDIPAVGVTALHAAAHQAQINTGRRNAVALWDIKRGEVMAQTLTPNGLGERTIVPVNDLPSWLGKMTGGGTDASAWAVSLIGLTAMARPALSQALQNAGSDLCVDPATALDPVLLTALGARQKPGEPPSPLYARPPDAKLPGGHTPP